MYRKLRAFCIAFLVCLIASCAGNRPKKELTVIEQIEVDTKSAQGLSQAFSKQVKFVSSPKSELFLKKMAKRILARQEGFQNESVTVKIHDDTDPKLQRFFSFPGLTLSIPASFLKNVEFENELAAAISYELAHLMNRFLAKKVEKLEDSGKKIELFSSPSLFDLDQDDRKSSIRLATSLLYGAGYDTRGMASIFKRYPLYYVEGSTSDLGEKAVAFNIREAQHAKSEFLPQMKPIVRSGEFIQFKKELRNKAPNVKKHAHT